MPYVDGFLIPIAKKNIKAYTRISKQAGKVWKDHGALEYRECVLDDLNLKFGRPFPKAAGTKTGEVEVFSWIVYKSKADRNRINKAVMKDPRIAKQMQGKAMPFDVKRMSFGGFKVAVDS